MTRSEAQSNPKWVQLVRAVAIMAIVFDHAIYPNISVNHVSETLYIVTNWWDIPLLFIIGGVAITPIARTWAAFWHFVVQRLVPILGTYLASGALLVLASHFIHQDSWRYTGYFFLRLLYGGQTLDGDLTLMWLFTVYLLTVLIVTLLVSWVDSPAIQVFIALAMFALSVMYGTIGFLHFQYMPWGADLVLMTTLWMISGYYVYQNWDKMQFGRFYATAGLVIYGIMVYCRYEWGLNFELVLKEHHIKTPYMAAFVPLFMTLAIGIVCYWLAKKRWFDWLLPVGRFAVPIICMVQLTIDVVSHVSILNHIPALWFLGLVVPILIAGVYRMVLKQFRSQKLN